MKVKVEQQLAPDKWVSQDAEVKMSHRNNLFIKICEQVYVFENLREGTPVLGQDAQKRWVKVGKVFHGGLFLGEGIPYGEYAMTPEGQEKISKFLQGLRNSKW